MSDKTPASRALVNLSKALLDDANAECAELRARVAKLEAALEPFATFGLADEKEDIRDGLMRDRICDWFGRSDFDVARAARQGQQTLTCSP
jgi:hypothetical protein